MMNKDDKQKKDGELILNNYKKQMAEKMARQKADRGETMSSRSSRLKKAQDEDDSISRYGGDIGVNEPLEPEVLLAILNSKGGRR